MQVNVPVKALQRTVWNANGGCYILGRVRKIAKWDYYLRHFCLLICPFVRPFVRIKQFGFLCKDFH